MKNLIFLFSILLFSSCATMREEKIPFITSESSALKEIPEIRTLSNRLDSLQVVSFSQSNTVVILLDRIVKVDGIYTIMLDKESAFSLGIDNATYDYVDNLMRELNTSK